MGTKTEQKSVESSVKKYTKGPATCSSKKGQGEAQLR